MSRTLKPLFRPEVLRERLHSFPLPAGFTEGRRKLGVFANLLAGRDARRLTEENLKPGFLSDVFVDLLGYRTPNQSPDAFTIVPEFTVPRSQGTADAALGHAPRDGKNVVVAVEVKGPSDPLDIPHAGRRLSAVEQGFDYAINLGCDWIVVTSMRETRLYYKGADRFTCERFDLRRLAADETALRRFVFLLGAERVVPAHGRCHLHDLLDDSKVVGENITKDFYREYSRFRSDAFLLIARENPGVEKTRILSATQKLLDRVLFCAFAEDRGLLPPNTLAGAHDHADPYNPRSKWENFRGLFRSINEGNPALKIPRYNGGLFAADDLLDALRVPDEVCAIFKRFADFEYRSLETSSGGPALDESSVPAGVPIVDVEILGHIFEQSITDLERRRLELEGKVAAPDPNQAKARRKKEGAFYTPKFITRYIVEQALGPTLRDRLESLRARHHAAARSAPVRAVLADPAAADPENLTPAQKQALIAYWVEWRDELGRIRVLDPACGSGAFLIEAFDQLLAAYQDANARLKALHGQDELFDLNRQILQRNLYGVDLNEEAVEICRLSLWIKTAEHGKILTDLDHTIRVGNSVVDDPAVHPRAFDWRAAFSEVFADGGFDVVVGNPPYIRQEWIAQYKEHFEKRFSIYSGTADLCLYFIERGLDLLKPAGRLGFITSGTFARSASAGEFRQWLPTVAKYEAVVNLGDSMPFGPDVWAEQPTMAIMRKAIGPHQFPFLMIHEEIPPSIGEAMAAGGIICDESVFAESEWKFQPREITLLFRKVMASGAPLLKVAGGRMYRGALTGLNEAFVVDTATRDRLVHDDSNSDGILRRLLKGEDLRPWYQEWEGRWLIFTRRGVDIEQFPSVKKHLEQFREKLEPRPEGWRGRNDDWPGRKPGNYRWYEVQDSIEYYAEFDHPKLVWPDITKFPRFSFDEQAFFVNDTANIVIPNSLAPLTLLQSRLFWFVVTQISVPLGVRAGLWRARCKPQFIERLPIPPIDPETDARLSAIAEEITALARERNGLHLKARHRITDLASEGKTLNNALTAWWTLDFKTFRGEVKKAFKTDIAVRERDEWERALRDWRGGHDALTARIVALEEELNDRVYRLFGLTPDDVATLEDFQKRTKTFYPLGEV